MKKNSNTPIAIIIGSIIIALSIIYYANNDIPNELLYITDRQNSVEKLCACIDNKYLLNYEHGMISTLPTKNTTIGFKTKISDVVKRNT